MEDGCAAKETDPNQYTGSLLVMRDLGCEWCRRTALPVLAAVALVVFTHIGSGEPFSFSWAAAYTLFCAPPTLPWVVSLLIRYRLIHSALALVSWVFIAIWLCLSFADATYLVMPVSAIQFFAISLGVLALALAYRTLAYVGKFHRSHLARRSICCVA